MLPGSQGPTFPGIPPGPPGEWVSYPATSASCSLLLRRPRFLPGTRTLTFSAAWWGRDLGPREISERWRPRSARDLRPREPSGAGALGALETLERWRPWSARDLGRGSPRASGDLGARETSGRGSPRAPETLERERTQPQEPSERRSPAVTTRPRTSEALSATQVSGPSAFPGPRPGLASDPTPCQSLPRLGRGRG